MDSYFFDSPRKALVKFAFILVTYLASIIVKEFSIPIILPTVAIYFLSNIFDYFDIAFSRTDKVPRIRYAALIITVLMVILAVGAFALFNATNPNIIKFVNEYHFIVYLVCSVIWAIPLVDGVKCQCDQIRKSSFRFSEYMASDSAFQIMKQEVESKTKNKNKK